MSRESKQVTIGTYTYQVTQLGAVTGRKLHLRLAKLLAAAAPHLAALSEAKPVALKSEEGEAAKLEAGAEKILRILPALLENLSEEDLEAFWTAFAPTIYVLGNGGRVPLSDVFDEHFAGKYIDAAKLLVEVTKFNFGGFLGENLGQSA